MKNITKNPSTGLYELQISNKVFESKKARLFTVNLTDIEMILVNELPFKIKLRLKERIGRINLLLVRSNTNLIEIFISESASTRYWTKKINIIYYFKFKGELIVKDFSIYPKIQASAGFSTDVILNYSLKVTATTIGEVIEKVLEINKSLDDKIDYASEKALGCMELVLGGGFQIKLPNKLFPSNNNNKDSKV